jgi:Pyridoxamine 5'-phosphate oxidase
MITEIRTGVYLDEALCCAVVRREKHVPKSPVTEDGKDPFKERRASTSRSLAETKVDDACRMLALDHGQPEEAGRILDSCELEKILGDLFQQQKLAVLGTQGPAGPWGSLVAIAHTDDLRALVFVTGRSTRKYSNLRDDPHVALVLDNRSNELEDFEEAVAVTAVGLASEPTEADRERLLTIYLSKHPHLREFAKSPSSALFRVDVEKFSIVYQFQNVMEMVPVT